MAELIDKKATSKLIYNYFDSLIPSHYYKLDLVKANDCLQEEISELPTTTESEIRASVIDEFAEKCNEAKWQYLNDEDEWQLGVLHGITLAMQLAEQLKERE